MLTWLRSAFFNAVFLGGTVLTVTIGGPLVLLGASPRFALGYVRRWARLMLWSLRVICGIRIRLVGWEHLPPGACIIAAKHQSAFDTLVWLARLPHPSYVMKKELMDLPGWGQLARRCGAVGVDRSAGAAAIRALVRDGRAALAAGHQLVIFPEGTRTRPGERVPYQPGVAALANAAGAAVVPAATDSGLYWGRRAFQKRAGTVTVEVLPPLPTGLPRPALLAALQAAIEPATDRLLARAPAHLRPVAGDARDAAGSGAGVVGEAVDKPVD